MSILYTGSGTRSSGIFQAISKQLNLLSLKPVKRITFKFDPFVDQAGQVRDFMHRLSLKRAIKTNPLCRFKYEVVNDRSEPIINFELENGDSVLFQCNNLTTLDMLKLFNKHVTILAPKEEPAVDLAVATKTIKKAAAKAKRR